MEKSIHFGVLSIIIVSFALLAAGLALAEGEPVLTLDSPEDGDWFTNPNVTVVGTLGNVSRTLVLNMTNLGTTVSEGIDQMSGSLVYRVSPYFADEFNGNQLNTSKWTEVYSSQWLDVSSGWLILGSGGIDDYPLIASAAGMFPQDMDVPWEAEFRFKYDTGGRFFNVVGGGLTKSTYAADSSHMAVHHEHFEPGFYLYANGDSVRTMSSEDTGWNSYLLKYNPETEKYRVYMDGSFVSEFTRADAPTRFWFGSPLTGT